MYGSLALHNGTLFVGGQDRTARIRAFNLDGRLLSEGFRFSDPRLGRSFAAGLAVDDDHRLWVADSPLHRVRCFSLFGQEVQGLGVSNDADLSELHEDDDRRTDLRRPVDVLTYEIDGELFVVVASAGRRRHAVRIYSEDGALTYSLRSLGDPHGEFRDVTSVCANGRWMHVAERIGRVQVFRDLQFQFSFSLEDVDFEPAAIAELEDDRVLIANGGKQPGLFLVDRHGHVLQKLASGGTATGEVSIPGDVVVEHDEDDAQRRVVLLDQDGERVQVFTLSGRCYGAFSSRAL